MRFYPELNGYVSAPVLCAVPLAYISVLYMLRFYMEDKKAMQLSVLIRLFNACQVGLAVLMTYKLAANFIVWNPFMSNTEFTAYTEYWLFVHYLGKYLDLFESVIIVLRKRTSQLTTLHLVHHSSILVIWGWLLNVGLANGTASYGALVNSFVHAVMYGHLYNNGDAKCMVVTINKASVILCQVGQFISCIMHAVVAILFDRTIPVYASCIQLSYNVLLCILFSRAAKQAQFKREESQKSLRRQQELEQTIRLLNEIVEKQGDDPASPSKVD